MLSSQIQMKFPTFSTKKRSDYIRPHTAKVQRSRSAKRRIVSSYEILHQKSHHAADPLHPETVQFVESVVSHQYRPSKAKASDNSTHLRRYLEDLKMQRRQRQQRLSSIATLRDNLIEHAYLQEKIVDTKTRWKFQIKENSYNLTSLLNAQDEVEKFRDSIERKRAQITRCEEMINQAQTISTPEEWIQFLHSSLEHSKLVARDQLLHTQKAVAKYVEISKQKNSILEDWSKKNEQNIARLVGEKPTPDIVVELLLHVDDIRAHLLDVQKKSHEFLWNVSQEHQVNSTVFDLLCSSHYLDDVLAREQNVEKKNSTLKAMQMDVNEFETSLLNIGHGVNQLLSRLGTNSDVIPLSKRNISKWLPEAMKLLKMKLLD